MMFIEQASYVGDVLSYYTDAQLKESFINLAGNKNNIYQLAQNLGYKPKISSPAATTLTLYQTVVALGAAMSAAGPPCLQTHINRARLQSQRKRC